MLPVPPKGCFTMAMANTAAVTTAVNEMVAGIIRAITSPVTTAERSRGLGLRPRSSTQISSEATAAATEAAQISSARAP